MSPCGRSPSSMRQWWAVTSLLRNPCSISSVVRVLSDDSFRNRGPATPERVGHQVRGEAIEGGASGGLVRGVIRGTKRLQHGLGRDLRWVRAGMLNQKR